MLVRKWRNWNPHTLLVGCKMVQIGNNPNVHQLMDGKINTGDAYNGLLLSHKKE